MIENLMDLATTIAAEDEKPSADSRAEVKYAASILE